MVSVNICKLGPPPCGHFNQEGFKITELKLKLKHDTFFHCNFTGKEILIDLAAIQPTCCSMT